MIQLEIDGDRYSGFQSATVSRSLDAGSGRFRFEALGVREGNPFKVGSLVRAYIVDDTVDQLFLTGFIDQSSIRYSESSHSITFSGRHATQDVIDSTLDGSLEINGDILLKDAIQKVLDFLSTEYVGVTDPQGINPSLKKCAKVSSNIGQGAFDLIEQYARLANVLLTTDAEGNIVIQRGFNERMTGVLLHQINNNENNIKDAEINIDFSGRYAVYGMFSQGNPSTSAICGTGKQSISSVVDRTNGEFVDPDIRLERQYYQQAENASTVDELQKRAEWEQTVRKGRSISYNCTVFGHSNNGEIYQPNKIIKVYDDFGGTTDSDLLIKDVEYSQSINFGNITKLKCVDPNSFKLPPEAAQQSTSSSNGSFDIAADAILEGLLQ